jgi:hypothetical protein
MSTGDYEGEPCALAPHPQEVAGCKVIAKKDDLNQPSWGRLRSSKSPKPASLISERRGAVALSPPTGILPSWWEIPVGEEPKSNAEDASRRLTLSR